MTKSKAQMIPPDAYPQMLDADEVGRFSEKLRCAATEAKAAAVIEKNAAGLREAVLAYAEALERAGDIAAISAAAHEIKGFADTAGLPATARIAEGLCRYLEDSETHAVPPDAALVALYVRALGRSARDSGRETRTSSTVAEELAALAARKLQDAAKSA